MYTGYEIDEGLSPGDGLGLLLGIDEQQVTGPYPQVGHDLVGVGEVDAAHHVQRLVVVGIESVVLYQQLTAYDAQGVVVQAHTDAVGDADEVGGVDVQLTVDIGMCGGASDGHATFGIAVETEELVWYEAVDERQGHARHVEGGIDQSAFFQIGAAKQSELLVVEQQTGFDGVGVVLILQIDELRTEVADVCSLVGHVQYAHVGGHGDVLVLVHQDMVVAVQLTREIRHVGDYRRQFAQVDTVQRYRQVLQHRGVLVLCVDLHARTVVGDEVYLRLNLLVLGDEDIVVAVQVEFLISQCRTFWHESEAQAVGLHLCRRTYPDTHATLVVVIAQTSQSTMLVDMAVDEGVEHKLRVPLVVAYLSLIG